MPSAPDKVYAGNYEHLDHTADVQFHAWGQGMAKALEALGECLFDYVTEIVKIDEDANWSKAFDVEGDDAHKFIFRYLDELLYKFVGEETAIRTVRVALHAWGADGYKASVRTTGEKWDLAKHPQGTEVKAITYSAMQIHEKPDRCDLYVIVDI